MKVSPEQVMELRRKTSAGVMECRTALTESKGDMNSAVRLLRERGLASAQQKAGRKAQEGLIGSYIHLGGKIGVILEVNCETDFVARTDDFKGLVKELAMHIAWANPRYMKREEVPGEVVDEEKQVIMAQFKDKPPEVAERIVGGKIDKFYKEVCLLEQPFVKDPDRAVKELIQDHVAKLGENIQVKRFARFQVGQSDFGEAS